MWPRTTPAAVDEIRMALAASANHAFRRTLEGKRIPVELWEPIEKLKAAYPSRMNTNCSVPNDFTPGWLMNWA